VLDLIDRFEESAEFMSDLRSAAAASVGVRLIFDAVEEIRPAAMLLLLAEIDRCRRIYSQRRVIGTYPANPKLERVLEATGFFALLGVRHRSPQTAPIFPLEHIKFITGQGEQASRIPLLRQQLLGPTITMTLLARSRLFGALSEAMINVGQHAYPSAWRFHRSLRRSWWLAGSINKMRKELTITFCDLGVGIPQTLPRLYPMERIREYLALLPTMKPPDASMIQAAVELGRSATGQTHRGKGLSRDLRRFIEYANAGEMFIFSNRGMYKYSGRHSEQTKDFSRSIHGTLIKWRVPMSGITDWTGDDTDESAVASSN
jgi:hypothetical protein